MVIVWRAAERGREFLTLRAAGAADAEDWAWRPPSGGMEDGETARECAARELLEETGLDVDLLVVERASYPTFVAEAAPDAVVVLSHEHDAFAWVEADELVRRTRPSFVAAGLRSALFESGLGHEPILGSDTFKEFGDRRFRLRFFFTSQPPAREQVTTAMGLAFAGDRLVLIEHARYGGLQPPGGHLEAGETPVEALRRELIEEAAVDIVDPVLIGYEEIELLGEVPHGYRYPVPSYQLFFAASVSRLLAFAPHEEASARRLLAPEEARASWAGEVPDLYEHALAVATGRWMSSPADSPGEASGGSEVSDA